MEDGLLKMVSTDGRRLAYIFEEGMAAKTKKKAIVPTLAVNDIVRIISGDVKEENIKIGLSENQFGAAFDDIIILSVLIEGVFPNYEQVIPKKPAISVSIKNEDMLSAVKRIKTIVADAPSSDAASALVFSFDNNLLKVSATAAGIGYGETEIEIEYKDKPAEIRFNPEYIEDVLKNIGEEFLTFEFSDALNPAKISPQNKKNYLCVVMPMRI
jgi:DNA polymerase-3 subunit beta